MSAAKPGAISILCVDDSTDIIDLLAMSINREQDMKCVGCLSDASNLAQHVARLRPDVVLIDLTMPDIDPLEAICEIRKSHPNIKPIVYSGYDDPETISRAMEAGACGFLSKHEELPKIFAAIRRVAGGEVVESA